MSAEATPTKSTLGIGWFVVLVGFQYGLTSLNGLIIASRWHLLVDVLLVPVVVSVLAGYVVRKRGGRGVRALFVAAVPALAYFGALALLVEARIYFQSDDHYWESIRRHAEAHMHADPSRQPSDVRWTNMIVALVIVMIWTPFQVGRALLGGWLGGIAARRAASPLAPATSS